MFYSFRSHFSLSCLHSFLLCQIGPPLPLADDNSLADLQSRLHGYVNCFTEAPFTFQRLCELLVEPHKQYTYLHKVVRFRASETLLHFTATRTTCIHMPHLHPFQHCTPAFI